MTTSSDLVVRLRKMARWVCIAVEEPVAGDISDSLTRAAAVILELEADNRELAQAKDFADENRTFQKDRADALEADKAALVGGLKYAEEVFNEYANLHTLKGNAEGYTKAERNITHRDKMTATLAKHGGDNV